MCRAPEKNLCRDCVSYGTAALEREETGCLPSFLRRSIFEQHHGILDGHEAIQGTLHGLSELIRLRGSLPTGTVMKRTLMRRSRVDGFWMIPVSSSENFFCTPALYSSTVLKPCFAAMAGVNLSGGRISDSRRHGTSVTFVPAHLKGYSWPSAFSSQSASKK